MRKTEKESLRERETMIGYSFLLYAENCGERGREREGTRERERERFDLYSGPIQVYQQILFWEEEHEKVVHAPTRT